MTLEALYEIYRKHPVISTDSRNVPAGCLFFALKGETFNGNLFAGDSLEKGAAYSIVDEAQYAVNERCILVNDVLETLQQLAGYHRRKLSIPFIAICGSNGKTTTKELVMNVLKKKYRTIGTRGNLNNHIGVPLTLLSIPAETEIAVIEIGANHIGETADLCKIAEPDYGLVTNNGKDHLEGFGSIEGVRKANGELYTWLKASGGKAFVADNHADLMKDSEGMQRITYGLHASSGYYYQPVLHETIAALEIQREGIIIRSQLAGAFNWENMAAAITIGLHFNVPVTAIKDAIESYQPGMNRSQVLEKNGVTFIMDCYNANPSSMQLAIESFAAMHAKKKAVILGDMLELGSYAETEHRNILELVKSKEFDKVILIGKHFGEQNTIQDSVHFTTSDEAHEWFIKQNWKNWSILLKGSRGYKLEKVIEN